MQNAWSFTYSLVPSFSPTRNEGSVKWAVAMRRSGLQFVSDTFHYCISCSCAWSHTAKLLGPGLYTFLYTMVWLLFNCQEDIWILMLREKLCGVRLVSLPVQ